VPVTAFVLGSLSAAAVLVGAWAARPGGLRSRRPEGPGGELAAWRPGRRPPEPLASLAREAGLPERWVERVGALLGAASSVVAAVALLVGPVPAVIVAGAFAVGPWLAGPSLRRRRRRRRDEQLPVWLERLASGLRAGLSLTGALAATATTTPAPLGPELVEVERAVAGGQGLGRALARWAQAPDASPAVVLVVAALDLGARAGGEVARAVDRVAATLRDRVEAQAEVRALATQARASAAVLAVAPLGFTVLLGTLEPEVPRVLFTTPLGWACLAGGLGLEAASAAWMARIVGGAR
jgi:tight adherence protein B